MTEHLAFARRWQQATPLPDIWGELARRCYISRELAKTEGYRVMYGGGSDPWMAHILRTEMLAITLRSAKP